MTDSGINRRLDFEGAVNFRDIGGYCAARGRRVRWGRLYRSDNLGALTDRDLGVFERLGIRTLIDLRIESERELHANRIPPESTITTVRAGFMTQTAIAMLHGLRRNDLSPADVHASMIEQYRRYVTDHTEQYGAMLRHLVREEQFPALIHCTSGKDRTGFAIAIVLLAVGAARETIVDDYMLTNRFRRDIGHLFGPTTSADVIDVVTGTHAAFIEGAFDQIDASYGSIDAFLERGLALSDDDRASLTELLTE